MFRSCRAALFALLLYAASLERALARVIVGVSSCEVDKPRHKPITLAMNDGPSHGQSAAAVGEPPEPSRVLVERVLATPRDDGYQAETVDLGTMGTCADDADAVDQVARQFISVVLNVPEGRCRGYSDWDHPAMARAR